MGFLIVLGFFGLIVLADLLHYLVTGAKFLNRFWTQFLGIIVVFIYPILYLFVEDFGLVNDCCAPTATFSPGHTFTIYLWIVFGMWAFFYSVYRKDLGSPIVEVLANIGLFVGIILNVIFLFHLEFELWLVGSLPIILLFLTTLAYNQKEIIQLLSEKKLATDSMITKWAVRLLWQSPLVKLPIFLLLVLPLFVVVTTILLLFGQEPDSSIKAFTQTYKHGLSQLDYMCDNVDCGGHYLCSVAANGHEQLVKPIRLGVRNGGVIVCNRQLLLSNAFEELMEERVPKFHRFIRKNYNRVGDMVHKYYGVFERKWVSDVIYILMKPLELIFWLVLYSFDQNPENRIAKQYLSKKDRDALGVRK
ncbi:MAG TPA: hypothetical protein ENK85_10145 [Saprospiraceae bacterium]|nr:hypothetical protein [Saprospiraceae bacterium]